MNAASHSDRLSMSENIPEITGLKSVLKHQLLILAIGAWRQTFLAAAGASNGAVRDDEATLSVSLSCTDALVHAFPFAAGSGNVV